MLENLLFERKYRRCQGMKKYLHEISVTISGKNDEKIIIIDIDSDKQGNK